VRLGSGLVFGHPISPILKWIEDYLQYWVGLVNAVEYAAEWGFPKNDSGTIATRQETINVIVGRGHYPSSCNHASIVGGHLGVADGGTVLGRLVDLRAVEVAPEVPSGFPVGAPSGDYGVVASPHGARVHLEHGEGLHALLLGLDHLPLGALLTLRAGGKGAVDRLGFLADGLPFFVTLSSGRVEVTLELVAGHPPRAPSLDRLVIPGPPVGRVHRRGHTHLHQSLLALGLGREILPMRALGSHGSLVEESEREGVSRVIGALHDVPCTTGSFRTAAVIPATAAHVWGAAHERVLVRALHTASVASLHATAEAPDGDVALRAVGTSKHLRATGGLQEGALTLLPTGSAAAAAIPLLLVAVLDPVVAEGRAVPVLDGGAIDVGIEATLRDVARVVTHPVPSPVLHAERSAGLGAGVAATAAIGQHLITVTEAIRAGGVAIPAVHLSTSRNVAHCVTDTITNERLWAN